MFKLILGLGNKDIQTLKKISLIYAKLGIDIIDCSIDVACEIQNELKNNNIDLSKIKFCISTAIYGDIHNKKAKINKNCIACKTCINKCSQKAIEMVSLKPQVNSKKCTGCSKCTKVCPKDAIDIYEQNTLFDDIEKIKKTSSKIDILELHADIKKKKKIIADFEHVCKNYKGDISLCISRKYFGTLKIIKLLKKLKEIFEKYNADNEFYIQADGLSINNGSDELSSGLETIAFYKELSDLKYKITISGGCNQHTVELCKLFNIKPYAIGFGTYARKLALENETEAQKLVAEVKKMYD